MVEREYLTTPILIVKHLVGSPPLGEKKGICVFCGLETEHGFDVRFPDTFVSFDRVYEGDVICEYCYFVFKDPRFRRKSWLVTTEEFRFLDGKEEMLNILLDPPSVDWIMYITRTKRKHGWINLIEKLNKSNDQYYVGFDETLLFIKKNNLVRILDIVNALRSLKVSKSEILTAMFSTRSIRNIINVGKKYLLDELRKWTGSPLLELVLFLVR